MYNKKSFEMVPKDFKLENNSEIGEYSNTIYFG